MTRSSAETGTILIVRHGKNRGPRIRLRLFRPAYFQPFLTDLSSFDPALRQRVRVWDTGNSIPDLSNVDAVLFLLQDPLAQQHPACFEDASRIQEEALRLGARIANPPTALSLAKSEQAAAWIEAGLMTPEPSRFSDATELRSVAASMQFPVLIKHELQHSQSGMRWVDTLEDLHEIPFEEIPCPGSMVTFFDVRDSYRQANPESPFAEYFHKKRALIFGRSAVTNHLFFSAHPIVGSRTSTFSRGRSFNPLRRWSELGENQEHLKLDFEYFAKRTENEAELLAAAEVLGLEFLAIDYSTLADGSCVLWEANPHFALHLWPRAIYARERRLEERIHRQHTILADYLRSLLRG